MAVTVSACLSANITPQLHARSSSDYLMHVSLAQSSTSARRPVHRVGQNRTVLESLLITLQQLEGVSFSSVLARRIKCTKQPRSCM